MTTDNAMRAEPPTADAWPTDGITSAGLWVTYDRETWRRVDDMPREERATLLRGVRGIAAWVDTAGEARDLMRVTEHDAGMRDVPPTAAEVRAVARLWGKWSDVVVGTAVALLIEDVKVHGVGLVPSLVHLIADGERVSAVSSDGDPDKRQPLDELLEFAHAASWQMVGPDGPLSWARVAELVAEMSSPVVTRPAEYDGGAVCTRCNGARVVDGDACVCAGGAL